MRGMTKAEALATFVALLVFIFATLVMAGGPSLNGPGVSAPDPVAVTGWTSTGTATQTTLRPEVGNGHMVTTDGGLKICPTSNPTACNILYAQESDNTQLITTSGIQTSGGILTSNTQTTAFYASGATQTAASFYSDATTTGASMGSASGANAYAARTNGARYDFGAGASDYASSDGTTVDFAGPVEFSSTISANTGAGGNLHLLGSFSVAAGKAIYFNGPSTLDAYLAYTTGTDTMEISGVTALTTSGTITATGSITANGGALIGRNTSTSSQLQLIDTTNTRTWYTINNNDTLEWYNNAAALIYTFSNAGDLTMRSATNTFDIVSATNAATASTTVGAVTISPSAVLGADDLVLNVEALTAGANIFTVDLEGDTTVGGNLTTVGGAYSTTGVVASIATTLPLDLTSDMNDATASSTVPTARICTSSIISANDLVFGVGTPGGCSTELWSVDAEGDVVSSGGLLASTGNIWSLVGDIQLGGGDVISLATGTSFDLESRANDAAVSPTVASITLTAGITDYTDGDLLVSVNASAGTNIVTINEQGQIASIAGNGTAGSGTGITVDTTGAIRPFVHKITVTFAAMTAAATTDITVWTFPTKTRFHRMIADYTTVFAGGALTDVDVVCGKAAGTNEYLITHDVDTAIGTFGDVAAEIGASLLSATYADVNWGSTQAVVCRFTCTGANCNAATTGSATYYLEGVTFP